MNNIPIHTPGSSNQISVKVIKVGHEEIKAGKLFMRTYTEFVDGPDSSGGIGAMISFENLSGKTIKYATVYLEAYNSVGDSVCCEIRDSSIYGIEITGPLAVGKKNEYYLENMWFNRSIVFAKIEHVHVIYMDNSEEIYPMAEFYDTYKTSSSDEMGTLTITRVQKAGNTQNNGLNWLECVLSSGESFKLVFGQTISVPVKKGTYTLSLNFPGQGIVSKKYKISPQFEVNGDINIEISSHLLSGGYKFNIY